MTWDDMSPTEHPGVTLAKQHMAQRERVEAMRERDPEPDLRRVVAELADMVAELAAWTATDSRTPEDRQAAIGLQERAVVLKRLLS